MIIRNSNNDDQYFKVKSIQEQRKLCPNLEEESVLYVKEVITPKRDKEILKFKQKKQKEYIKSIKKYYEYDDYEACDVSYEEYEN